MTSKQIKFINEGADKYFRYGNYEFFAIRQGREGYTLEAHEWYHVPDEYLLNKFFSKKLDLTYYPSSPIADIKERIVNFINSNK